MIFPASEEEDGGKRHVDAWMFLAFQPSDDLSSSLYLLWMEGASPLINLVQGGRGLTAAPGSMSPYFKTQAEPGSRY